MNLFSLFNLEYFGLNFRDLERDFFLYIFNCISLMICFIRSKIRLYEIYYGF